LRETCYRYKAKPTKERQAYFTTPPIETETIDGSQSCAYYIVDEAADMPQVYTDEDIQQKYLNDIRLAGFFDKDNPHGFFDGREDNAQPQFRLVWNAINAPSFILLQGNLISLTTLELIKSSDVVWTQPCVAYRNGVLSVEVILIDYYEAPTEKPKSKHYEE